MTTLNTLPLDAITCEESKLVTTSLKVAEAFGKRHAHVLEKIKSLDCSDSFTSANFSAHVEMMQAGAVKRESKVYQITKDGFMFLVMGFTGKKAAAIKEAYINAFNSMAEKLKNLSYGATLNAAQQSQLKNKIHHIADQHPIEQRASIYSRLYNHLKSSFGVTKYAHIPASQFSQALSVIDSHELSKTPQQIQHVNFTLPKLNVLQNKPVQAWQYGSYTSPTPIGALLNELQKAEKQNTPILISNVQTAVRDLDGLIGLLQTYELQFKQIRALTKQDPSVNT